MVRLWVFLSLTHTYGGQGLIFYFSNILGLEVLFSCQEFHIKESIYGTRVMLWCCLLLTNVTQRQRKFRLEASFCLQILVEAGTWGFISMISLGFQILFCYKKFNFKQIFLALWLISEVSFCWLMLYKNKKFHIHQFCFSVCIVTVTFRALILAIWIFLETFVTHCYERHIHYMCRQCWQPWYEEIQPLFLTASNSCHNKVCTLLLHVQP